MNIAYTERRMYVTSTAAN